MCQLLYDSYINLYARLYYPCGVCDDELRDLVEQMKIHNEPMNARNMEFDGTVLSSIKTDSIILEAINKIMGTVFLTNQFLVPDVQYNNYTDIKVNGD
jgi:hypothetical protein